MLSMFIWGILVGAVLTLGLIMAIVAWQYWRGITNRNPDWARYGDIQLGDFSRFEEGVAAIFPVAPARSYLTLRAKFSRHGNSGTEFYLRSVGKRKGAHRFRAEIRIPKGNRKEVPIARGLLEETGATVDQTEKSYGQVTLESSDLDEIDVLVACARRFARQILDCPSGKCLAISWHVAGSGASEPE